ncbi:MAG: hypothetical protein WC365_07695 [Candidatus Babeliales bacterium]
MADLQPQTSDIAENISKQPVYGDWQTIKGRELNNSLTLPTYKTNLNTAGYYGFDEHYRILSSDNGASAYVYNTCYISLNEESFKMAEPANLTFVSATLTIDAKSYSEVSYGAIKIWAEDYNITHSNPIYNEYGFIDHYMLTTYTPTSYTMNSQLTSIFKGTGHFSVNFTVPLLGEYSEDEDLFNPNPLLPCIYSSNPNTLISYVEIWKYTPVIGYCSHQFYPCISQAY